MSDNTTQDPQSYWETQYTELESGGGSQFLFPKSDRTRVRLIGDGHPSTFSAQVESTYGDKVSTKFLVFGFEVKKDEEPELRAIVMTKTTWRSVCGLQAEGYDLFSEDGFGLIIIRDSKSGRTSYSVMPAPVKIAIPDSMREAFLEADFEVYQKAFKVMQDSRKKDGDSAAKTRTSPNQATEDIAQQIIDGATAEEAPW